MASQTLTFSEISSDPASVIRLVAHNDDNNNTTSLQSENGAVLAPGMVLVKFLAAPINPQDLMVIAGRYPVKPVYQDPTNGQPIPGNDGVGRIEAVGPTVQNLTVGNLVIPKRHGLGTWRSHAVLPAIDLLSVPSQVDLVAASLLKMSCCPAYLLLEDMRDLRPGDWIVLNAANSAIGQMVAQFAHLRGCHTLGVVREISNEQQQEQQQPLSHSHDVLITEADLETHGSSVHPKVQAAATEERFQLALDAVFGVSGGRIARLLSKGGTFVNYGSLGGAGEILAVTQELLFWKQITFRNFRLSEALGKRSVAEQERLVAWFAQLLVDGKLQAPVVEQVRWDRQATGFEDMARRALRCASTDRPVGTKKQVFVFA